MEVFFFFFGGTWRPYRRLVEFGVISWSYKGFAMARETIFALCQVSLYQETV